MRASRLVRTTSIVPTPESRNTGATDNWMTCATALTPVSAGTWMSGVIPPQSRPDPPSLQPSGADRLQAQHEPANQQDHPRELHQMEQAVMVENPDHLDREPLGRLNCSSRQAHRERHGHGPGPGSFQPGEPSVDAQREEQRGRLEQEKHAKVSAAQPGGEIEAACQRNQGRETGAASPLASPVGQRTGSEQGDRDAEQEIERLPEGIADLGWDGDAVHHGAEQSRRREGRERRHPDGPAPACGCRAPKLDQPARHGKCQQGIGRGSGTLGGGGRELERAGHGRAGHCTGPTSFTTGARIRRSAMPRRTNSFPSLGTRTNHAAASEGSGVTSVPFTVLSAASRSAGAERERNVTSNRSVAGPPASASEHAPLGSGLAGGDGAGAGAGAGAGLAALSVRPALAAVSVRARAPVSLRIGGALSRMTVWASRRAAPLSPASATRQTSGTLHHEPMAGTSERVTPARGRPAWPTHARSRPDNRRDR